MNKGVWSESMVGNICNRTMGLKISKAKVDSFSSGEQWEGDSFKKKENKIEISRLTPRISMNVG